MSVFLGSDLITRPVALAGGPRMQQQHSSLPVLCWPCPVHGSVELREYIVSTFTSQCHFSGAKRGGPARHGALLKMSHPAHGPQPVWALMGCAQ